MSRSDRTRWILGVAALALSSCSLLLGTTKLSGTAFGTPEPQEGALQGRISFVSDGAQALPDFATQVPVGSVWATHFDIATRDYSEGFPGVTDRSEWFAIQYAGTWHVPTPGKWQFRLVSDDGARWLIDGKVVVDNDGVHATREAEGSVDLTAAPHKVELQYFQGPATQLALRLLAKPPGGTEEVWTIN